MLCLFLEMSVLAQLWSLIDLPAPLVALDVVIVEIQRVEVDHKGDALQR